MNSPLYGMLDLGIAAMKQVRGGGDTFFCTDILNGFRNFALN